MTKFKMLSKLMLKKITHINRYKLMFTVVNLYLTVTQTLQGLWCTLFILTESRKENPQKPTQLSSRSHPRHLVGKRTAQKTPS